MDIAPFLSRLILKLILYDGKYSLTLIYSLPLKTER